MSQRNGSNMSIKLTDTQLVLLSAASQREDLCLTAPTGARLGPAKKAAARLLEAGPAKSLGSALKLSDTQLVLLSAAAQRDDRCLTATPKLKGGAAQKVAEKLIAAGLVKQIKAKAGTPVWRRDEETAQSFSLKLTAAGLKAIAVDDAAIEEEPPEPTFMSSGPPCGVEPSLARTERELRGADFKEGEATGSGLAADSAASSTPRPGSKLAEVLDRLRQDQGATIDELMAATNWLPHTTRAALTGLRKRGYEITRNRLDGLTRYKILFPSSTSEVRKAETESANIAARIGNGKAA
jgi:uncharacterized protein DUF3489